MSAYARVKAATPSKHAYVEADETLIRGEKKRWESNMGGLT